MKLVSDTEFVLLALVIDREMAGREVAKAYEEHTKTSISYGTLYTTFRRLKEQKYVDVRDDEDEDGRVRFFKATDLGNKALNAKAAEYKRLLSVRPKWAAA